MAARAQALKPHNASRWLVWCGFALVLAVAPWAFGSSLALTLLSQCGIAIVACLSYNILLGQGGMLSFGHAVYTGLASFLAVHALNRMGAGTLPLPVSLLPLVGGLGGMLCASVLGYLTTRRAGTGLAMITLGLGELVFALALMLPQLSGGEAGVSTNRVVGAPVLGISYGPQRQVYYLIALYTFFSVAAMFAFTRTPLGRMLNAVRDNAERVGFIGYDARRVRYLAFVIAGFFAGIAGGMHAVHFEIATAEVVGAARSGAYLLFTVLGGATLFFGPIIGGVLMVLAFALLSAITKAWLLYLGLVFILVVMYAPGGIAGLLMEHLRLASSGKLRRLWAAYLALGGSLLAMLAGTGAMVEMVYHLRLETALGPGLRFLGATLDAGALDSWCGAALMLLVGGGLFELSRRRVVEQWGDLQGEIEAEAELRRREAR